MLRDVDKRRAYDGTRVVVQQSGHRKRGNWTRGREGSPEAGTRRSRGTDWADEARTQKLHETVAEKNVRELVYAKQVGRAVMAWQSLGAPLDLCEYMLEQCRVTCQFPGDEDLQTMLDALHAAEAPPASDVPTDSDQVTEASSLVAFVAQMTTIYNALIWVANNCGELDPVFHILDEMELRGVDKDVTIMESVQWGIYTAETLEKMKLSGY